ncbi:MAG: dTDP-4-dehydrorhamnose 3,5-epimerase [Alphaproteobacteria bacterium]|nr:dTDP-4-dehydrorhamnose 3,5-epimerase [Alphaproteobacteria bacterium]
MSDLVSKENAGAGPHIVLYGGFGIGNTGNDATLEVALAELKKRLPAARFTVAASMPGVVERDFGAPAVAIREDLQRLSRLPGPLGKMVNEFRRWSATHRLMRSVDYLVVPGTGVFDDLLVTTMQHAYPMWRWCAAAKQAGAKVMFVSIGAGPVERPLNRRFFGWTAAMADHRSYRDENAKAFVRDRLGVDTSRDVVTPDLVFGLDAPRPPLRSGARRTIGIGVMDYHTWRGEKGSADDIYEAYMGKLAAFSAGLLKQGNAIHILVGDVGDAPAAADLRNRLVETAPDREGDVTIAQPGSLRDLCGEVGKTDIVVATRYHTVVSALICGRPAISLGYAEKNRAVMTDFGLGAYCQNIRDFDPGLLQRHFDELSADLEGASASLADVSTHLREAVSDHLDGVAASIMESFNMDAKPT